MAVEVGSTTNTLSQAAERYGQNLTVTQASAIFNTAEMQSIAGALGLNWSARLITLATFAANDVVRFIELYAAETLSIVGYISNSYGFPLAVSSQQHEQALQLILLAHRPPTMTAWTLYLSRLLLAT